MIQNNPALTGSAPGLHQNRDKLGLLCDRPLSIHLSPVRVIKRMFSAPCLPPEDGSVAPRVSHLSHVCMFISHTRENKCVAGHLDSQLKMFCRLFLAAPLDFSPLRYSVLTPWSAKNRKRSDGSSLFAKSLESYHINNSSLAT